MFTCGVRHGPHTCLACWPVRCAATHKPVCCSGSGSDAPACTSDDSLQALFPIHTAKAVAGASHYLRPHLRPKKDTNAFKYCNNGSGLGGTSGTAGASVNLSQQSPSVCSWMSGSKHPAGAPHQVNVLHGRSCMPSASPALHTRRRPDQVRRQCGLETDLAEQVLWIFQARHVSL